MHLYEHVSQLPEDPILGITIEYNEDNRDEKVLLAVGIYREKNHSNTRMECVYEAEKRIIDTQPSKAYLPIDGNKRYLEATFNLLFGHDLATANAENVAKIQTLGGTGALRLAGDLLVQNVSSKIHFSTPTWPNHKNIFNASGAQIHQYPYYNDQTHEIRYDELKEYLKRLSPKEIVLLHACCHNPTGVDLTKDQWIEISKIMKERELIALFDTAYQGFGEGIDEDMFSIRHFAEQKNNMLVACSHSKTFGLYGERIGALFVFASNEDEKVRVLQNLKKLARGNYSNPPRHGAALVDHIVHSKELKNTWENELKSYRERLSSLRTTLIKELKANGSTKDYDFFQNRRGLFCFTGLSKEQVIELREKFGIYMTLDGRMNISGLNEDNIQYVTNSIVQVGG